MRVIHDPEITDTQRHEAREYAREQVGDRYNFLDMPPLAFFLLTGFRSEIAMGWAQTCSELVANCLWHCEISLGKRPATVLPADIAPDVLIADMVREAIGQADVVPLAPAPDITDVSVLGVRTSDGQSIFRAPGAQRFATVYAEVQNFVSSGGVLPKDGSFLTGEG